MNKGKLTIQRGRVRISKALDYAKEQLQVDTAHADWEVTNEHIIIKPETGGEYVFNHAGVLVG